MPKPHEDLLECGDWKSLHIRSRKVAGGSGFAYSVKVHWGQLWSFGRWVAFSKTLERVLQGCKKGAHRPEVKAVARATRGDLVDSCYIGRDKS